MRHLPNSCEEHRTYPKRPQPLWGLRCFVEHAFLVLFLCFELQLVELGVSELLQ